jgi:hypothetical protein
MTYVLVCALCAGTVGDASPPEAARDVSTLASGLELDVSAPASTLAFASTLPLADHSGHDGGSGSHISPMWIVMAVMMVGMMVAFGVYMMRGSGGGAFETGAVSAPHLSAVPVGAGFRPGG